MSGFRFKGRSRQIMLALIDAMAPRWEDYDPQVEVAVLARLERMLDRTSPAVRLGMVAGLWAFEAGGPPTLSGLRPFSQLSREDRVIRLEKLNHSRLVALRRLVQGYKLLISMTAYSDPRVEAHLGAERGRWWANRRALRARLVAADTERALPVVPHALGSAGVTEPDRYLDDEAAP